MFLKLTFIFVGLICLSECKPYDGGVSPEDYEEMDKFNRAVVDYLNQMTRSIESYLNPIYDLFSFFQNEDPKNIAHSDRLPLEIDPREVSEENEVRGEIYDDDFYVVPVIPKPPEDH